MSREEKTKYFNQLHGLIILGITVVLYDLVSDVGRDFYSHPVGVSGKCVYQVFAGDKSLGTFFTDGPETLSKIASRKGIAIPSSSETDCGVIPCNRSVKFGKDGKVEAIEYMPGAHLLLAGKKININEADRPDLTAVPGIGPELSKKIIESRDMRGGSFYDLNDLATIPGIGKKKFNEIIPYLEIREPDSFTVHQNTRHSPNLPNP